NINNAKVEFFVSRRGAESPPLGAGPAQIRAEGQLFLNSVVSFQPNSANLNTLDFSAQTTIPAQFIPADVQTQTVFLTATVTTGDNSTSPFSIGKVPQFVSGGGGGGGCALTANPTLVNVLNAPLNQPTNRVVALSNTGTGSITITGIDITPAGPPWALDIGGTLPITLNPGDSKNITVGFTPTNTAPSSATLNVTNSCTAAPLAIPLAGSGVSCAVGVSTATLNFGTVPVSQSATLQVGVINFCTAPVTATPALNQTTGSGFSIASAAAFTIPAQSVVNFNVTFTPSSSGTKTGTLVFSTPSASPTSLTVNLTGSGGDSTPPTVVFSQPSGGSLAAGQQFQVVFGASDAGGSGLGTFVVSLSTDGGANFAITLGSGTAIDGINTITVTAPSVESANVRIRVQVRDQANNVGSATSNALTIGTPPVIIAPSWTKKFTCVAAGSNIQAGAVLISGGQSWPMVLNVDVWVVTKPTLSTPGGIPIRQLGPPGSTAVFTVRNPSGLTSAPVSVTRPQ
ncbi:MAG TPA: choice-of-anchor D domain-containing protein, partial [Blastocatellia bacterium]|nr:choice-of-anchor D domain-containing protein [Blastocatellia bacterium]